MDINVNGLKVYIPFIYINLDKDIDRKISVENECNQLELKYDRYSAVNKANIHKYQNLINDYSIFFSMNDNEKACAISHLNILKKYQNSEYKYIGIFEDDIYSYTNGSIFKNYVQKVISLVPNLDIVYFGQANVKCSDLEIIENPLYRTRSNHICTHAYMISQNGIDIVLNSLPINKPIDIWYSKVLHKQGHSYVTLPSMIHQSILTMKSNSRQIIDYQIMNDCVIDHKISLIKIAGIIIIITIIIWIILFK
jgi:GR25 family glycosyltransferase involved in LPS biosynthesis